MSQAAIPWLGFDREQKTIKNLSMKSPEGIFYMFCDGGISGAKETHARGGVGGVFCEKNGPYL